MLAKKTSIKTTPKKTIAVRKPVTSVKNAKTVQAVQASKPLKSQVTIKPLITKKPRSLHLGMHAIIAGSAICVMLLLGVLERNTFVTKQSSAEDAVPATIGIEHNAPLSMSILLARKEQAGYVSITNQSSGTIHINLPSVWTRTEVTGALLKDVAQEIPVFGFSRWTLPGKAGMKLLMPSAPSALFFDSVSASTAAIDLKTIDLTTYDVTNRVILVHKQTLVPLWTSGE